ncbi:MAG TPA: c-type cytochrome [Panacibacter sp.]|nr:c-type cytochrome [Panacibacter sp.]HNP44106.1 c-type cytochrome [Panacibacter sp.]
MKKVLLPATIAFVVFVLSCKHQVVYPGTNDGNSNGNTDTTGNTNSSAVCFEGEVLPIFVTSCGKSGCHDAASHKEGYVLDSYSNIVKRGIAPGNASKSELYKVIAGGEMPPKGNTKLTSDQVALIKQWIDEGAKNTTGCMACDTSVYTYNGAISKIMTTNCTGCHSSVSKSGGVDLSTFTGVQQAASNGTLLGTITHAAGYPAMPQGGNKLSDCNIRQIQKWIESGALNN